MGKAALRHEIKACIRDTFEGADIEGHFLTLKNLILQPYHCPFSALPIHFLLIVKKRGEINNEFGHVASYGHPHRSSWDLQHNRRTVILEVLEVQRTPWESCGFQQMEIILPVLLPQDNPHRCLCTC